ncbi:four-carbon acid sugar kinase family protein [Schaalia naturae]|uniref:Four-carbon acid sugar kinase family protein n=1 Tax=Schaalia naturae TaxID=635203 RepID=A0ABW2SNJ8_9ACTO
MLMNATNTGRILILADDFTGAGDTGILFRTRTVPVAISLHPDRLDSVSESDAVRVILTDTRTYPTDEAARIAGAVARTAISAVDFAHVYQKIDSTMRGSVGAEVAAVLAALGRTTAVLCPAFPEMGRTVVGGKLLVDGEPITRTQYARDPRKPILHDRLCDIVHDTDPGIGTCECRAEDLPEILGESFGGAGGARIVAVDAQTDGELQAIAEAIAGRPDVLPVGAAGLGRALSGIWLRDAPSASPADDSEPAAGPGARLAVVASGSANPRSIAQLAALEREMPGLPMIRVDKERLTTRGEAEREMDRVCHEVERVVARSRVFAIALSDTRMETPPYQGEYESFVARAVAHAVRVSGVEPAGIAIVIAGADTSHSCCRELGIDELYPQREVVTGIPWSTTDAGIHILSKAGGFGADDALARCLRFCLPSEVSAH